MPQTSKKLTSASTTSLLMAGASMGDNPLALDQEPCIYYPICFKENEVRALIDSGSEVNAMTPGYASKLSLKIRPTDVGAQKIDGSTLETSRMVLASFQVEDKLGRARYFQETFLLADISVEVVLGMPFLTLRNADIQFAKKELTWRSYTAAEALTTTKQKSSIRKNSLKQRWMRTLKPLWCTCNLSASVRCQYTRPERPR